MSEKIEIIGAKTHNLKNVSVSIPKNKLVVITGLSWSWKSSLAFDTLYAEWQKRYLESLSTYARMIISNTSNATKVQEIRGLSPTIAINQKTVSNNPRSTVGTITEIYDFYRLLYANIGIPFCINHPDQPLKKDTIQKIYDEIIQNTEGTRFYITFPFINTSTSEEKVMSKFDIAKMISELGFVRFLYKNEVISVADSSVEVVESVEDVEVVVDRLVIKNDENFFTRLKDSLMLASEKTSGTISIYYPDNNKKKRYSLQNSCAICGYELGELSLSNFSFNSHYGACETCGWLGYKTTFEEEGVINEDFTILEWAVLPWATPYYTAILEAFCHKKKIPLDIPYKDLSKKQKELILFGSQERMIVQLPGFDNQPRSIRFEWVIPNLERRFMSSEWKLDASMKTFMKFATEKPCRTCRWYRLKPEYLSVKIGNLNIGELSKLSVDKSLEFFKKLEFSASEKIIVESVLKNIIERLEFLQWVWLAYVSMDRRANSLSGGESQRIRLATQIWTRLEGIIYVLDEPSIGLHPRDNDMLIANLKRLSHIGNTVVVVEHDEDIMRECDYIIDIGPGAWVHGGNVIFTGTFDELIQTKKTETGKYLANQKIITRKNFQKVNSRDFISIYGATENNLKDINVRFPLGCMTVVTGVSGSGKSSLVIDILSNALLNYFNKSSLVVWKHKKIEGMEKIDKTIIIDQSPIGKTPHSNVATYTGVFTYIREVFAASLDAKTRWFAVWRFSFNTRGGRCEVCEWTGTKKVEMHFLPDVYVECESCGWTRYNSDTLSIRFKWKNIAEVLNMTIEDAAEFFVSFPRIKRILDVLIDVGLWYITLWQSAPTLSGWESQRIKLAFDLSKRSTGKTLYILDEPTTGLHFSDVQKLLDILDSLVEKWNTVIIIEHNLDIIANADAIIDIGPEWWEYGWNVIFSGPREKILNIKNSHTAEALKRYLKNKIPI